MLHLHLRVVVRRIPRNSESLGLGDVGNGEHAGRHEITDVRDVIQMGKLGRQRCLVGFLDELTQLIAGESVSRPQVDGNPVQKSSAQGGGVDNNTDRWGEKT